jgi:hypothetical protein
MQLDREKLSGNMGRKLRTTPAVLHIDGATTLSIQKVVYT